MLDFPRRFILDRMKASQAKVPDSNRAQILKPSEVQRLVPDSELSEVRGSEARKIAVIDLPDGKKGVVAMLEPQIKHDGKDNGASYTISAQSMYASEADLRAAGGFDGLINRMDVFYEKIYEPKSAAQVPGTGKLSRSGLKAETKVASTTSTSVPRASATATRTDFGTHI